VKKKIVAKAKAEHFLLSLLYCSILTINALTLELLALKVLLHLLQAV